MSIVEEDLSILGDLEYEWPALKTLGIVGTIREERGQPVKELDITVRYYISSAQLSPKEMLEATRSHWSIESQLHWRLDVGMREDDCPFLGISAVNRLVKTWQPFDIWRSMP